MITKPKGTNDILPGDSYRWHYLENTIRKICRNYACREIRTPIFESTELFVRGVGDGTDIVDKEMYTFLDRGDRSITLRPEGTASAVRAYLEHSLYRTEERQKQYYIGPMFRYERPQAGRFRQHYQFGLEIFGEASPWADVEVFSIVNQLYRKLGLQNVTISINSVGCSACRPQYIESLKKFLEINKKALCADCTRRFEKNPLRALDCKNPDCRSILDEAPQPLNYVCKDCRTHHEGVVHGLDILGIDYEITPSLVRGLDYYTRTVFEFVSHSLGAQNAIGGGGRYDRLISDLGGPQIPAVGFAAGLERIILTMDNDGIEIPNDDILDLRIIAMDSQSVEVGFRMAYDLRGQGVNVDIDFREKSLKAQLRSADRNNEKFVLVLGENELKEKRAKIKNLLEKSEKEIRLDGLNEILEHIRGKNA